LFVGSAALAPAAYRQWKEADRWRGKARKIEARGRDRMNVGKSLKHQYGVGLGAPEYVPATLMSSHDRKQSIERIGKSMPLSEIGKAFAMPRIRIKPLAAPIKRTSPIRRGTFVRTPAGQTTYRRGSL